MGSLLFQRLLRNVGPEKKFRGAERQSSFSTQRASLRLRRASCWSVSANGTSSPTETLRRAMGVAAKRLRDSGVERAAVQAMATSMSPCGPSWKPRFWRPTSSVSSSPSTTKMRPN